MLSRARLALVAIVSTLLTSFILLAGLPGYSPLPKWIFKSDQETDAAAARPAQAESSGSENSFTLHPADHALREATTLKLSWRITSDFRRPDGVLKQIYLINDAFPGPTIEARTGDRLIIDVQNDLDGESLSLHWHGLSMRGSNGMDGAVGITQAPIEAGHSFTYNFTIEDQHGTFWYHAHDGVQRADGLYGGLVVHEPATARDTRDLNQENLLLIGDWYHRSAQAALEAYMHPGAFGLETVPDSIVVNGRGAYNCRDAVPARPVDCESNAQDDFVALNIDLTQRSILRVVNVGAYAGFSIKLDGANLTPFTVDGGHRVKGLTSKTAGFTYPGERVSYLVEQGHLTSGGELEISLDEKPFKYQNPALTSTQQFPVHNTGIASKATPKIRESFDLQDLVSEEDQSDYLPPKADQTIVLYALTQKLARLENEPHGFINHTTWKPQTGFLNGLPRSDWDQNQLVPQLSYSETAPLWIDIVLNNLDEEGHPFHLHGYDFWVLTTYSSSFNWGSYNPFEDAEAPGGDYDLADAVKRDTVYVPRRGYAVLRFKADNPGIWMFHCHVLWHLASGMAMAFEVNG